MTSVKSAISIHIIWPLAAQETLLGNFEEIEPEHFFNGILKFAEYDDGELAKLVREVPKALHGLIKERDALRTYLAGCNIKVPHVSTDIRRKLRIEIGQGNFSGKREKIHRSPSTCEAFRQVEDNAGKRGLAEWSLNDLVELLLRKPSPPMKKVMAEYKAGLKNFNQILARPVGKYLDIKASPLSEKSEKMGEKPEIRKEAVFPVIIEALKKKEKSLLLIQHGKISVSEIIKFLEEYFKYETDSLILKDNIIMKIEQSDYRTAISELEIKMDNIFRRAEIKGNIFLFINSFQDFIMRKELYGKLKEKLKRKILLCIAGTDSYNYNKYIQIDNDWKKYFRPIWIHDRVNMPEKL